MEIKISPSLLAADFLHLDREIEMINNSDADWLHLDIMDGTFVPNISFGFPVLKAVAKACSKPLDVHYMIINPEKYISQAAELGVYSLNVHVEACGDNLPNVIKQIKQAGMKAAVTISPDTPVESVVPYLNEVHMVLIMGVHPGFGGQKFIEATIERVAKLRKIIDDAGLNVQIEVDGGVQSETAPRLIAAGCDVLVSGSYVFRSTDPQKTIKELKG